MTADATWDEFHAANAAWAKPPAKANAVLPPKANAAAYKDDANASIWAELEDGAADVESSPLPLICIYFVWAREL